MTGLNFDALNVEHVLVNLARSTPVVWDNENKVGYCVFCQGYDFWEVYEPGVTMPDRDGEHYWDTIGAFYVHTGNCAHIVARRLLGMSL